MDYRREIDGLRALAVVSVILFHAGVQAFNGGFVGVDIFFIISGYLITSIILAEKQAGTFTLLNFYERRARRILPALFFVLFACLPFAWLWLLPTDLIRFSQSLVAVSGFVSNVFFIHTGGYFVTAELIPLLHTWSLAVEEQYYVLFPIFLLLIWRLGKHWIIIILAVVAATSLGVAQWGSLTHPTSTFFQLPTRGWEILLGAFAAFYLSTDGKNQSISPLTNQSASLFGFLLIAYAVFTFDKRTPSPGLYTLIPNIGTILIILFATPQTYVGKLLGSKLLVGIGLISYSAYLWHQPLFAFARHRSLDKQNQLLLLALAVASIVLAYFSWKYIETPFRNKQRFTRKQIFAYGAMCSIFFVAVGLIGHLNNGFLNRFSVDQQKLILLGEKNDDQISEVDGFGKCIFNYDQTFEVLLSGSCVSLKPETKKVILFGDSEAAHLMGGIRNEFSKYGYSIEQWTGSSCRALDYSQNDQRCRDFYNAFINKILPTTRKSDLVIVSSRWISLYNNLGESEFASSLNILFENLKKSGAKVIVVGNTPEFLISPYHIMVKNNLANKGAVFLKSQDFRNTNLLLKSEADKYEYIFINPANALCRYDDTLNCMVANNSTLYFFDAWHLSTEGSMFVIKNLLGGLKFSENILQIVAPQWANVS